MTTLYDKFDGVSTDIVSLDKKIELLHNEQEEIQRRRNNLVVKGVPEKEGIDDMALMKELFEGIKLTHSPNLVIRLGEKRSDARPRTIKVIMSSYDNKREVLRETTRLRQANLSFDKDQ